MEYLDQSANNLILTLVKDKLDLSQFNVLKEAAFSCKECKIVLRIIGGSHLITYRMGDLTIHEIFACNRVKKETPILLSGPLEAVCGNHSLMLSNTYKYEFGVIKRKLDEEEINIREIENVIKEEKENTKGLIFEFPENESGVPKTMILLKHEDCKLNISTVHSYPNENNVVYSYTTLHLDGGNK